MLARLTSDHWHLGATLHRLEVRTVLEYVGKGLPGDAYGLQRIAAVHSMKATRRRSLVSARSRERFDTVASSRLRWHWSCLASCERAGADLDRAEVGISFGGVPWDTARLLSDGPTPPGGHSNLDHNASLIKSGDGAFAKRTQDGRPGLVEQE